MDIHPNLFADYERQQAEAKGRLMKPDGPNQSGSIQVKNLFER
jgi:hypothetical protein